MHNRKLTYTYINDKGEEVNETGIYWFNLSKREVIKLEVDTGGGLSQMIKDVESTEADNKKVFEFFEKFVLMSYGIREDEGRRFAKSDELYKNFSNSLAYDALFDELAFSENSAEYLAGFIKGTLPLNMISPEQIEQAVAEMKEAQAKTEKEAAAIEVIDEATST